MVVWFMEWPSREYGSYVVMLTKLGMLADKNDWLKISLKFDIS